MRLTSMSALAAATLLLEAALASGRPVQAQAPPPGSSAARGKVLFLRCSSCHAIAANAPAKIGPNLAAVIGRKGGTLPGYRYSQAMKAAGPVWNDATLDRWLAGPNKVVPGTSMAFVGLASPADRQAVIAYLKAPR